MTSKSNPRNFRINTILKITVFILCCYSYSDIKAQTDVTGYIENTKGKSLTGVNVKVKTYDKYEIKKMAISDSSGKYIIKQLPMGYYSASIQLIGFKTKIIKFHIDSNDFYEKKLENIRLEESDNLLSEVTVNRNKPMIERKEDRITINIGSGLTLAGNTAVDILKKAPGIDINPITEQFSLNGRTGALVTIDDKPTYMSSTALMNMLKSMSSNQIESIDLISDPSSRYDATGTAGIINIKTKKQKDRGLLLELNGGWGHGLAGKYDAGFNLDYSEKKISVHVDYNYFKNQSITKINSQRKSYIKDTVNNFDQSSTLKKRRTGNNYKFGFDYHISKLQSIGIIAQGYLNQSKQMTFGNTQRIQIPGERESIDILGELKDHYKNNIINLNYFGKFDSIGRQLAIGLDYSAYYGRNNEIRRNDFSTTKKTSYREVNNSGNSKITIKAGKIDYTHPFDKKTKLEFGLKSSVVTTENNLLLSNKTSDSNIWLDDPEATGKYIYKENINAGYFSFSKQFSKTEFKAGVRVENTMVSRSFKDVNKLENFNYTDLFPSVSISQKIKENYNLSLTYSRRIDRPSYDDLNPYLIFIDEYNYAKGNPYLNPQYTQSLSLTNTIFHRFNLSVNYSSTRNPMINMIRLADDGVRTIAIKENLGRQKNLGVNLSGTIKPIKNWSTSANLQIFNSKYNYQNSFDNIDYQMTSFSGTIYNTVQIKYAIEIESSFRYRTALQYGIYRVSPQAVTNLAIRKSFFENKLRLELAIDDLFDGQKTVVKTDYNMQFKGNEKYETRIIWLSARYRFNNGKSNKKNSNQSGIESEGDRLKR
ncbi:TonB-dependent receptor [Sphingobacterium sp. ML3W]|uniref:outer membrane beta-barrel protein n=1 Tax=Sphingobacterium sp. ML3W TaxID=1538644 RepID=UPI002499E823|nr:outer membrane beta-barrel protein [Sphingobacterium sp. ML3W]WFA78743.1 TonB-dependent receptor [Sphingobacterium sp. ML3W]